MLLFFDYYFTWIRQYFFLFAVPYAQFHTFQMIIFDFEMNFPIVLYVYDSEQRFLYPKSNNAELMLDMDISTLENIPFYEEVFSFFR